MKMSNRKKETSPLLNSVGLTTSEYNVLSSESAAAVSRQDWLVATLVLCVFCLIEVRLLQIIQLPGFNREVLGAQGLLHGVPELRAFQNRVLGPILVALFVKITGQPYAAVYCSTLTFLIALPNFVCFILTYKFTNDLKTGLWSAFCFSSAVVALQDDTCFFLWDAIELTTMLVFAYAVFHARDNLQILVPVFVVQLLNRESAEFVALWIIFASVWTLFSGNGDRLVRIRAVVHLSLGFILLLFGAWWTHMLRMRLFRHSFDKHVNLDLAHKADGQWFTLMTNLKPDSVTILSFVLALVTCLGLIFILYRLVGLKGREAYPVVWLISGMIVSAWLFGLVVETRVWLEFVPFGILYLFTVESQTGLDRGKINLRLTE